MQLTTSQKQTLKTYVLSQPDLQTNGDMAALAALLNVDAAPVFWAWRTAVTRQEIYTTQNDLPIAGQQTGFWEWDTYKAQTVTEQGTWREMFMFDALDFSKANNRNGVVKIFSGTGAPAAQRDHCLAIGRKKVSRVEKVFATGTGSTASPGTLGSEGPIGVSDVIAVMNS